MKYFEKFSIYDGVIWIFDYISLYSGKNIPIGHPIIDGKIIWNDFIEM